MTATIALLIVFAFFCGAVPFGFIAGRRKGIDLREHGSKNIGATNTLRVLGKTAGITVLLLDAVKGLIPVLLAQYALSLPPLYQVGVGLAAVLGHIYSPFVRFKGGKGVATTLGVLIGLNPLIAAISFGVFFVTVWLTKYVSLGSILGAVTQAVLFWVLRKSGDDYALPAFGTLVALFVIARHRANIGRLLAGTESKWGEKKGDETGAPDDAPV
ncbi:MAG: glycerol-3-phosphate 1-O-acyltransferase PlsY [Armatimonadetes bacterium]|nr:glycerol-3-phosphate 1-O-acyltransferase PlsY [Armatimonadota bacterium]